MKVVLVPSAVGSPTGDAEQFLSSYLLDDTIAVDAGSLGFCSLPMQQRVHHVLLSHAHFDHVASLPVFLENVYDPGGKGVTVYGHPAVLETLQTDVFNDRIWPNLFRIAPPGAPFARLQPLEAGVPLEIDGRRITPVPLHHLGPTFGFLVEEPAGAVLLVSDTGPTDQVWEVANRTPNLRAVFLEAAFPNELASLAEMSRHLTPALFAAEAARLRQPVQLLAVHLKARYREQIAAQLHALGLANLEIARPGHVYQF